MGACADLAELCLEGSVNLIEGTTKSGELFASLIGDQKLGHALPVDVPGGFESYISNFLPGAAHFLSLSRWANNVESEDQIPI